MAKAYLGLGSNIGDKKQHIDQAIDLLSKHQEITVVKISSYYETDPVGYLDQDVFLNIVVEINTSLEPFMLLEYCNKVEEILKRERIIRWGPRTIDIDILLYEGITLKEEKLMIPHPRMKERAFVIVPLYEIAKDVIIDNLTIDEIIKNLNTEGIRKVNYGG